MKYIKTFEEFVNESKENDNKEYNSLLESLTVELNEATDEKISAAVDNLKKQGAGTLLKMYSELKSGNKYGNWNEEQTKKLKSGVRKQLTDKAKGNSSLLAKIKKVDPSLANSIEKKA